MKKYIISSALAMLAMASYAQNGGNTSLGGAEGNYESLAEKVLNLEKKNNAFNVYLNYASSFQTGDEALGGDEWSSAFRAKQLRLEIKGEIGDHLYYRLRHRLNRSAEAKGGDNFAKATDIMMAGWKFNDHWSIEAGKMCQMWGGMEYDENPMYIYQYSDMVNNMDNFMAGVTVSYKPVKGQEIAVQVTDCYNGTFADEYGSMPVALVGSKSQIEALSAAKHPLTYIANWNGTLFNGLITTRWSWGTQTQAEKKSSQMLIFGQQLNLPNFQWYVDYMGEWDDIDRLKIASSEIGAAGLGADIDGDMQPCLGNVQYHSLITKANWQFAPQWNLMLKGMYETASVNDVDKFKNYRKSFGYIGSVEYYPAKGQDLRVFLSYIGRKYDYTDKCGLRDYNTNRIELGFMYRIKAF